MVFCDKALSAYKIVRPSVRPPVRTREQAAESRSAKFGSRMLMDKVRS